MGIRYVDYEGEAGTGDGTSFANRARSIKALYNQADKDGGNNHSANGSGTEIISQADEIRVKKSPDPTSLGTGEIWRNKSSISSGDYNRGFHGNISTIAYSGTTGSTQITTNYKHDLDTGDWIAIYQNTNSQAHINGLWKVTVVDTTKFTLDGYTANSTRVSAGNGSGGRFYYWSGRMIELGTKVIEEIAFCRDPNATATEVTSLFTPVDSNVTVNHLNGQSDPYWATQTSIGLIGPHSSQQVYISTTFTGTGKAAHYELPATLDLSSYQKVSFQCYQNSGYRTSVSQEKDYTGTLSLRLCTDTAGNTSVHTIPIDSYKTDDNGWMFRCTKDFGANLNASIKSIAIYVDNAVGTLGPYERNRWISICNVVACKADSDAQSVTHEDLVGLNSTDFAASGQWYPVWALFNNNNKTCIVCQINAAECQGMVPPQSNVRYNASVFWPGGYQAGSQSKTIYKRKQFWHQIRGINSNAEYTMRFYNSNSAGFPLRISGGWNATDMSTKTAGDITCIDAETCENGSWYFSSPAGYHSSGSGQGMHADGEIKSTHIEDFVFTRHRGYFQVYGNGFSIFNCGFSVVGTGFYFYFSKQIKKFGLNMFYGFSPTSPWSTSYHGARLPEHSSSGTDLFLTNSDGSHHSTYNENTRYIKWTAGGGESSIVEFGHGANDTQPIRAKFKLINTEGHASIGLKLGTGANTNLVIQEVRCGWTDGDNYSSCLYTNVNAEASITIEKLYTTLNYRGWDSQGGKITVNEWYDEDFGAKSTSQGFHGLQYYHYQQGGYFYQYSNPITSIINGGTIKRYIQLYGGAKLFTDGLTITETPQMTSEVQISAGAWQTRNHDGTSGNNFAMYNLLFVYADTTVRRTASGYSMKLWPRHQSASATIEIGQVIFKGGSQVTVSLWFYKDSNNVKGKLSVGGLTPLSGISAPAAVEFTDSDSNNTWVQKSINFTPTGDGAGTIFLNCYQDGGSNDYMWVDDMTISQA